MKRILDLLSTRFIEGFVVLLPVLLSYLLLGGLFDLMIELQSIQKTQMGILNVFVKLDVENVNSMGDCL